jgi:hypothetical protein
LGRDPRRVQLFDFGFDPKVSKAEILDLATASSAAARTRATGIVRY